MTEPRLHIAREDDGTFRAMCGALVPRQEPTRLGDVDTRDWWEHACEVCTVRWAFHTDQHPAAVRAPADHLTGDHWHDWPVLDDEPEHHEHDEHDDGRGG